MAHWGWYWKVKRKHIAKTLCSKLTSIDSFKIMTSFNVQPLDIKAERKSTHLVITYRKQQSSSYTISIDKLHCNYGGYRYYFRCPLCQKRMRILYLAENSIFLCRKCLNLGYKSQRLRPSKRYEYMSQKTKQYIKDKGGDLQQYKKPPRMHNKTYQMLANKQSYYQTRSHQTLNKELRQWFGAKIEPYLEDPF